MVNYIVSKKLDREMRSRYQVIVGCERGEQNSATPSDRSKRSTGINRQSNRRGFFTKNIRNSYAFPVIVRCLEQKEIQLWLK